jgi:uncharacterized protein
MGLKRHLSFIVLVFSSLFLLAQDQDIPVRPSPPQLYNNLSVQFPDFISAQEASSLEQKLDDVANTTSNQVAVVVIDSLYGRDINEFATALFNKWGIGQKKEGNGVLLLVKPTGGPGGRDAYIVTGYGLEGAIPDLTAKKIIEHELIPEFKNGNYAEGINKAVDAIVGFAKGEYNSDRYKSSGDGPESYFRGKWLIIVVILIVLLLRIFRGGGGMTMTRFGGTYWGGNFGGGSFGGGGGGGFGGFGGGSSGGGGAGGKW